MLTNEQIKTEITGAPEHSAIHGLVRAIAYQLFLKRSGSPEDHWYAAQQRLLQWPDDPHRSNLRSDEGFEYHIASCLKRNAYYYYIRRLILDKPLDPLGDWLDAQNDLGYQVLSQTQNSQKY